MLKDLMCPEPNFNPLSLCNLRVILSKLFRCKIAKRDAWKVSGIVPFLAGCEVVQHLDSVERVVGANETLHHVDLTKDVQQVQHFDEEVKND